MASSSSEYTLLYFDLVEEILRQIPTEYLIRIQLVCKQWYSLYKNQGFIYRYLDVLEERFLRIDCAVRIINPVTQTRVISPLPDVFRDRPKICYFVHCDGLVLLRFQSMPLKDKHKLAIWNPILGKIKWIQPLGFYWYSETYGMGYNNVSRDNYKILRIFDRTYDPGRETSGPYGPYGTKLEIYDLKSNSWSTVDIVSLDWSRDEPCNGVSVSGNMYWVAHWKNRNSSDPKMFIQSFDFSSQTFKPRSPLPFQSDILLDPIALSCFRRDKLSLLHQIAKTKEIEVLVTNKVDEEVMAWSKYLNVANPDDLPTIQANRRLTNPEYFIDKNGKIRVWCYETSQHIPPSGNIHYFVSVYEIGKNGIKKEDETGRCGGDYHTHHPKGYAYVPSLVPIPE